MEQEGCRHQKGNQIGTHLGHLQTQQPKVHGQQIHQGDKKHPLPAQGQQRRPPGFAQRLEQHIGKDQHRRQGQ